eukprot:1681769-Rhodomonas_salina.1
MSKPSCEIRVLSFLRFPALANIDNIIHGTKDEENGGGACGSAHAPKRARVSVGHEASEPEHASQGHGARCARDRFRVINLTVSSASALILASPSPTVDSGNSMQRRHVRSGHCIANATGETGRGQAKRQDPCTWSKSRSYSLPEASWKRNSLSPCQSQ